MTTHRAGFGPHCHLIPAGTRNVQASRQSFYHARWRNTFALNRDGTKRAFGSADSARAWLAAADVTNGATARPL